MENFYDITKGQLITLWVFAVVSALYASSAGEVSDRPWDLVGTAIFFGAIFYTLGWRNNRKRKNHADKEISS